MADKEKPPLPSLEALQRRIDEAAGAPEEEAPEPELSGMAAALRLGVDLLAGVIVGVLAGLGLDRLFGSTPWFLIICIFLGAAGGMRNMIRSAQRLDKREDSAR